MSYMKKNAIFYLIGNPDQRLKNAIYVGRGLGVMGSCNAGAPGRYQVSPSPVKVDAL